MLKPKPAFLATAAGANARKTHHQFVPGLGYVAHAGPPDVDPHPNGGKNCDPPAGAADGSLHAIKPPGGHPPMAMRWVAAERAWASLQPEAGNRLAWSTSYLSRAGWEYAGAVSVEGD